MPARRMAIHQEGLTESAPEKQARRPHLIDDGRNRHLRAEVVARHRDGDAARIEPRRHVAEHGGLERAPIAAVDEERERARAAAGAMEQIDDLARAAAVGEAELGALLRGGALAVGRGLARPAGKNLRMLRHPCPVVVLDFVIHSRHAPPPLEWAECAIGATAATAPVPASRLCEAATTCMAEPGDPESRPRIS